MPISRNPFEPDFRYQLQCCVAVDPDVAHLSPMADVLRLVRPDTPPSSRAHLCQTPAVAVHADRQWCAEHLALLRDYYATKVANIEAALALASTQGARQ